MEVKQCCWVIAEDPDKAERLEAKLQSLGWDVKRLSPPLSGCCLEDDCECRVGVVQMDGMSPAQLCQLESLILRSQCLWLAVASDDSLKATDSRKLIAMLCHVVIAPTVENDELGCLMGHAFRMSELQQHDTEQRNIADTVAADASEYEMVGTTPAMWKLFQTIRKVAAVEAPVFISGESGTGKELTAQAIHERSSRSTACFHAINCGALPDHLIQSELFGHEKGAFTGAVQRKIGRIEATDGGTLFLDEIGDLPFELQVNLLRFLETRCIQRVGGLEDIAVDVRIIAATHVDLELAVEEGRFREDLYHRLNVLQINVPPLREHQEDIEILARYFFERFASEKPSHLRGISREALLVMRQYSWPGNVRELINRMRRAMIMCENRLIQPEDLGIERRKISRQILTLEQAKERAEREALVAALGRNKHKIHPVAKELGVSRVTIYRLMEKHALVREANEAPAAD
ncbi:sigma-54 interaction domain-containing protein [Halomonas saccharevitans]|uniref:DNA-binding transcriptional response regulator, NtrC family, contains REC, AAA-type ATPase, and a Fis-type DNA-binding domains n=1 Tax=Halomonas saccharevitans TaxID=416872 RepID=A0A1I6ZB55_9GAMM|nr:sigma-54 dependent transcriptional regulator [Halomonas saccharevitans]SFT59942.1 DNA-binding transcriptional response regulator, NtrC family, contains REC, AAA-type ATPase, and a Fis-type DNA-binding domains [Halomonas saccharevitans]